MCEIPYLRAFFGPLSSHGGTPVYLSCACKLNGATSIMYIEVTFPGHLELISEYIVQVTWNIYLSTLCMSHGTYIWVHWSGHQEHIYNSKYFVQVTWNLYWSTLFRSPGVIPGQRQQTSESFAFILRFVI